MILQNFDKLGREEGRKNDLHSPSSRNLSDETALALLEVALALADPTAHAHLFPEMPASTQAAAVLGAQRARRSLF